MVANVLKRSKKTNKIKEPGVKRSVTLGPLHRCPQVSTHFLGDDSKQQPRTERSAVTGSYALPLIGFIL